MDRGSRHPHTARCFPRSGHLTSRYNPRALQNPALTSRLQKFAVAVFSAAVLLAACLPSAAFAGTLAPGGGSSATADDVNLLFLLVLLVGFAVMVVIIDQIYSAVRRGTSKIGPGDYDSPWAGHAVAASVGLVIVLSLLGANVLHNSLTAGRSAPGVPAAYQPLPLQDPQLKVANDIKPPAGPSMSVYVNGQQYLWRYTYTGSPTAYSYHDLVIPVGVTVMLDFTSSDVVHSWWVPQLGGPIAAVPGFVNKTWIRVDKPGIFNGVSTTLSGTNYADMTTRVIALPLAKYELWIKRQSLEIQQAMQALGRQNLVPKGTP